MTVAPPETVWLGTDVSYHDALRSQEAQVTSLQAGNAEERVLLLEHSPVYTIGRTRDQSSLGDTSHLPYPAIEINRGGQATYHGPGQLVGYPILDLRNYGKDLHAYLRTLEEALVVTLADYEVTARRREGLTGVWIGERKIASIGVGVRKWIAMHGFALNVTQECLKPFLAITPCGIDGVQMTSLYSETPKRPTTEEVGVSMVGHLNRMLATLAAQCAAE